MKSKILIVFALSYLMFSCNNDDDQALTLESSFALAGATASISNTDLVTIDLETGNTIASSNDYFVASILYADSFIGLFENRIVRSGTTDLAGDQIWETIFATDPGFDRKNEESSLAIENGILYYTYSLINTTTFDSTNFIEAINLENGTILWTKEGSLEFKLLTILNNTLIAVQESSPISLVTSRSLTDGSIINSWELLQRISHLIPGENEVIVMSWSDKIYSIQENLSINWIFDTNNSNVQRGAIIDNQFFFHSRDEFIYALNLQSGELNWSQQLPDLFISDFFTDENTVWSVTRDFSNNTFIFIELDINSGNILSNFNTPVLGDTSEIEFLNFDDYLLIVSDPDNGATITQLFNYKSQDFVWENEIAFNNIFNLRANVLLDITKYTLTSF